MFNAKYSQIYMPEWIASHNNPFLSLADAQGRVKSKPKLSGFPTRALLAQYWLPYRRQRSGIRQLTNCSNFTIKNTFKPFEATPLLHLIWDLDNAKHFKWWTKFQGYDLPH